MSSRHILKISAVAWIILLVTEKFSFASSPLQGERFSIGGEIANPAGDFAKVQGIGFGLSLRNEAPLGDYTAMMITGGYIYYIGKAYPGTTLTSPNRIGPTSYMFPLQVGLKFYIPEQQNGFYLMMEGGGHGYKGADVDPSTGTIENKLKFAFSYAPEIGLLLRNFEMGARYQLVLTPDKTTAYVGLRVAYVW